MPNWVTPVQAIAALAKLHAQSGMPGDEKSHWREAETTVFEKMFAGEIQTLAKQALYIFAFGPEHRENRHVTPQFWHTWKNTHCENRIAGWVTGDLRVYDILPNGGKTLRAQIVGLKLDSETIPWSIDPEQPEMDRPAKQVVTKNLAIAEAREWLEKRFIECDPRNKPQLTDAALDHVGRERLSARSFIHTVWPELATKYQRDKAGAKPRNT